MFFSNLSYIEKQDALGDKNGPFNNVSYVSLINQNLSQIKKQIFACTFVLYSLIIFMKTSPDIFFPTTPCMCSKRSPMVI